MILNEKHIGFVRHAIGSPEYRDIFIELINDKINFLKDISNFKKIESEKDLSIEVIYAGRISAATILRDFAQDLLRIAAVEEKAEKKAEPSDAV